MGVADGKNYKTLVIVRHEAICLNKAVIATKEAISQKSIEMVEQIASFISEIK
jgi:hypothetical protein